MSSLISGYIGTYTRGCGGRGIYQFVMDSATGCIEDLRLAAQAANPSWLAVYGKTLYAAIEVNDFQRGASAFGPSGGSQEGGAVAAYRIEKDGGLTFLNQKPSMGKSPCHLAVDNRGLYLIAANYFGGTISVFPLEKNGPLRDASQLIPFSGGGPNRDRQAGPHPHSFMFDKNCAFGFAFDLGSDRIMAYRFNSARQEALEAAEIPWYEGRPGAGPRHGVFNAGGDTAYIINELDSTLDVLGYDPRRGSFERKQTISTLPGGCSVNSTGSELRISPCGRRVYASNRGHDSIALFNVKEDGRLAFVRTEPSGGKTPRDFTLVPGGAFLAAANQDSDNVSVFAVDRSSGSIKKTREYAIASPVCVLFV